MYKRLTSYRSPFQKDEAHLRIAGLPPRRECAPPWAGVARYRVPDTDFLSLQVRKPN